MCVCVCVSIECAQKEEDYRKGIELYIHRGMDQFGKKLTEQEN